jgi:hypothetical protein
MRPEIQYSVIMVFSILKKSIVAKGCKYSLNDNNNNSVQFFIIYVLSQQPNGQLQTAQYRCRHPHHRQTQIIIIIKIIIICSAEMLIGKGL